MASGGVSGIEAAWKFFQLVLITASGGLLLDLGEKKTFFLSDEQQTFIYAIEGAFLLIVILQMIGILVRMLTPKALAIILAILGALVWSAAAVIELRSYYYNFPKGIEEGLVGEILTSVISHVTPELNELKYKFLSVGILTAINAFFFLVEACGVHSWRESAGIGNVQQGFVFQRV